MRMEALSHADDMIARFKKFYGLRFDTDMARKLGLSDGSAIGNWRRRNTIDLLLIAKLCPEINLDWLIWGRGTSSPLSPEDIAVTEALPSGVSKQGILHLVNEALEHYLHQSAEVLGELPEQESTTVPKKLPEHETE